MLVKKSLYFHRLLTIFTVTTNFFSGYGIYHQVNKNQ
jgi:hypothetical protein